MDAIDVKLSKVSESKLVDVVVGEIECDKVESDDADRCEDDEEDEEA